MSSLRKILHWGYAPVRRARETMHLFRNWRKYVKAESYYPECPRKSSGRIFFEQLIHVLRYGERDEFYFLYGLDVSGRSAAKYVDNQSFMQRRNDLNLYSQHNYTCLLRDKFFFSLVGKAGGFPVISNIGEYTNGKVLSEGKEYPLDDFLLLHPHLFFKPKDAECGESVCSLDRVCDTFLLNDHEIGYAALIESLQRGRENTFLVQPRLIQHPEMNRLYGQSVNTIRIITVNRNCGNGGGNPASKFWPHCSA